MTQINTVAVIGLGSIALRHRRNLKQTYTSATVLAMSASGRIPEQEVACADYIVSDIQSLIAAKPFMVIVASPSTLHAEHSIPLLEAGSMLGAGTLDRFFNIVLPSTKASFITAASLGFAHTVGEFGVILMIGGNIPGETRVLSIALFDHVEAFDYAQAHLLAISLLAGSMVLLSAIYLLNRAAPKTPKTAKKAKGK